MGPRSPAFLQRLLHKVTSRRNTTPAPEAIDWRHYFPFPTPYPHQVEGIESAIGTSLDGGITVIEGACGTGKTLLGLTAAISLIRHPKTPFERILVVTSVKQQLHAFEDSLEELNEQRSPDIPLITGTTLVGKADLCPLLHKGLIDEEQLYDACQELREATRSLSETKTIENLPGTSLESLPQHKDTDYCPYYAQFLRDRDNPEKKAALDPSNTPAGLLDPPTSLERGIERGTCPHASLTAGIEKADVLIANYYHAFDPQTRRSLTDTVIGPETILVADEAHMLEPQVRSVRSRSLSLQQIEALQQALTQCLHTMEAGATTELTRDERYAFLNTLDQYGVFPDDLNTFSSFLADCYHQCQALTASTDLGPGERRSLRTEEADQLTDALKNDGWTHFPLPPGCDLGKALAAVEPFLPVEYDHESLTHTVAFLKAWFNASHTTYLRTLRRPNDSTTETDVSLALLNLVPSEAIAKDLDRFGASILMSATLAPLDVYRQVIGVEQTDRPVITKRFGMTFPSANRASFAVSLPPFTYANRGEPHESTRVRAAYAKALITIAQSPGNILVCLPSYTEATWAGNTLSNTIEKPVLVDEASGEAATEALKDDFFADEHKVLVTSLRGTLTEGVDYSGDRLYTVAICGVPVVDASDPQTQAIRAAYDEAFGDGYRTALAAPALRKTRQAVGRVIRGGDDVGVRILLDQRYTTDTGGGVRSLFPPEERDELSIIDPASLEDRLTNFWNQQHIQSPH